MSEDKFIENHCEGCKCDRPCKCGRYIIRHIRDHVFINPIDGIPTASDVIPTDAAGREEEHTPWSCWHYIMVEIEPKQ